MMGKAIFIKLYDNYSNLFIKPLHHAFQIIPHTHNNFLINISPTLCPSYYKHYILNIKINSFQITFCKESFILHHRIYKYKFSIDSSKVQYVCKNIHTWHTHKIHLFYFKKIKIKWCTIFYRFRLVKPF